MSDTIALVAAYGIIAFLWAVCTIGTLRSTDVREERRSLARAALAAPVWPLAFVYWAILGVRWLVREAQLP